MWFKTKSSPLDAVEQALQKREWKFYRVDEKTVLTGVATSLERSYMIGIRHEPERRSVVLLFNRVLGKAGVAEAAANRPYFRVHSSAGHDRATVAEVDELLMDRNFTTLLGNFERDRSDGEIRFRITLPYRDAPLTADQVNWCIDVAVPTIDSTLVEVEQRLHVTL